MHLWRWVSKKKIKSRDSTTKKNVWLKHEKKRVKCIHVVNLKKKKMWQQQKWENELPTKQRLNKKLHCTSFVVFANIVYKNTVFLCVCVWWLCVRVYNKFKRIYLLFYALVLLSFPFVLSLICPNCRAQQSDRMGVNVCAQAFFCFKDVFILNKMPNLKMIYSLRPWLKGSFACILRIVVLFHLNIVAWVMNDSVEVACIFRCAQSLSFQKYINSFDQINCVQKYHREYCDSGSQLRKHNLTKNALNCE